MFKDLVQEEVYISFISLLYDIILVDKESSLMLSFANKALILP